MVLIAPGIYIENVTLTGATSLQALGGAVVIFRCPKDRFGWFEKEGSSYEWNYQANGQPIVLPGVISGIQMTAEKARLMYDYENFHPGSTNGTKNVLHGDGHVAPIR